VCACRYTGAALKKLQAQSEERERRAFVEINKFYYR
jgi:hypothetical protein